MKIEKIYYNEYRRGGVEMYQKKLDIDIRCPLEQGLRMFGGKWKSRVICVLSASGCLRYSAIRQEMANITDAVLASTLKELMQDGIVLRHSYDEIPPRVEYSLSERGASVVPLFHSICKWTGMFYREDTGEKIPMCQHCDHNYSGSTTTVL